MPWEVSQQLYKCEVLFLKWEVVICPVRDIFWFRSFFPSLFCMTGFFLAMLPPHRGPPGLPQATQVLSLFRDMAPDSSADSFSSYLPQTWILNALFIICLFHDSEFFLAVFCLLLSLRWSATHSSLRTQDMVDDVRTLCLLFSVMNSVSPLQYSWGSQIILKRPPMLSVDKTVWSFSPLSLKSLSKGL